ncbi:MAG: DegT/DnrJ/EryC1/StrS family aminotransferase [Candidatus Latescibacteria bacterium]|nr:DegT/DnrJ/EryC1/StrS family aminotransferase [Candidatus Latescibacterota bacterium]
MSELAIFGGQPIVTGTWPKWPVAGKRERELLEEVLSGDMWGGTGLGPKITALNEKFAKYCDTNYGAAVANGTVSMELGLKAWNIGPGDEVIIPAATFIATATAPHHVGATVVYADIDPKTCNLDPSKLEEAITDKTRAIIPVHIGGHPCDMDPLMEIAKKHNIKVLEDAAQAHGAKYKGRKVGSLGDAASFSFQQSKNMQSGEGGIIISNDKELIDLIHYSLGKFGRGIREKYSGHIHYRFGWNACYTELQAALSLAQLERLEEQTEKRAVNAKQLYRLLDGIDGIEPLVWQPYCDRHGHHLFNIRFNSDAFDGVKRAQFLAALNKEGVIGSSFYPMPLYNQPLYEADKKLSMRKTECPESEKACHEIIFLEQNLLLADEGMIERIGDAFRKIRSHASELHKIDVTEEDFMGSAVLKKAKETAAK